jgi:AcrR family transcriptional regulator
MRADARKNYDHLLAVAREVVFMQGAEASLRDVARTAGVGLGTLYRHFPTREALLEALLRKSFEELASRADELSSSELPGRSLILWLREAVALTHDYRGVIALMVAAIEHPESALHASCVALRAAGAQLLERAQAEGLARADMDGADLFALISALAWIRDQSALASRADHLFDIISTAILTHAAAEALPTEPPAAARRSGGPDG